MIRTSDRFIAPSRGTVDDVLLFFATNPPARYDEAVALIRRVYDLCSASGIDFALAVSRIADETGALNGPSFFVSDIWRERLNPGGLGVTDGEDKMITFANGTDAADAYMAHLFSYIFGSSYDVAGVTADDDPRWEAMADERPEWFGSVKTLHDLTGKWFTHPDGAANSAARGNRIFPGIADQEQEAVAVADVTFKLVPHPTYQDRIVPSSQNSAWNNMGTRTVRAVVWHRMLGSLSGTDQWFRGGGGSSALTDYGVGVASTDGDKLDGVIYRWNDPEGIRSPWANGSVSAPYGDGLAFVNRFGVNAVNRDATAIEISGQQTTPLSAKSRAAICGITAYWADQAGISWEVFPAVPGESRSFVIWHQEFTIGTGKQCPFSVVMNETAALIEQTRGILKRYQTSATTTPKPPTYAAPHIPEWMEADLKAGFPSDHTHNGVQVFAALREYTATKATKRFQNASTDADVVGPPLKIRERFTGWYVSTSPDGKHSWIWTPYGTRILADALTPRVSIKWA